LVDRRHPGDEEEEEEEEEGRPPNPRFNRQDWGELSVYP